MALLAMLLFVVGAVPAGEPPWWNVRVLGWTEDGANTAWRGHIASVETYGGEPAGALVFISVVDARGRVQRLLRFTRESQMEGLKWTAMEPGETMWARAESEAHGDEWLGSHKLQGLPKPRSLEGTFVDNRGSEPLSLTVSTVGSGCESARLEATLGKASAILLEEPCDRRAPGELIASAVEISWSPDRSRAALAWNTSWTGSRHSRGAFTIVSRRMLAAVDLLDAGAGASLESVVSRLEGAGFRIAHRGKAGQPRKTTEIYFAPGFEPEAKEIAALAGASADSVKPLSWKSPYAVVVAAGSGK